MLRFAVFLVALNLTGCLCRQSTLRALRSELDAVAEAQDKVQTRDVAPIVLLACLHGAPRSEVRAALGAPTRCPSVNGVASEGFAARDCDRYSFEALPATVTEGGGRVLYLYFENDRLEKAVWRIEV